MLIMMGFTCNLRAILMKTSYEPPIDTSEQLVNSGKNPFVYGSSWAYDYFKNSENKWHNLVAAKLGFFRGLAEDKALDKKIAREGEDVKLLPFLTVASRYMRDPAYKNLPPLHFSSEIAQPYYFGWAVKKKFSIWREALNRHILLLDQVTLISINY